MHRSLLTFFCEPVTGMCLSHIGQLLEQYTTSKGTDWRAKDTGLHLVLAVAVRTSTAVQGAIELNSGVNVLDIFEKHVLPEVPATLCLCHLCPRHLYSPRPLLLIATPPSLLPHTSTSTSTSTGARRRR